VVLQTPAAMPEAVEREQLYFPLPYIRSDWIAKMKRYGYHKISTSYVRNIATLDN
jgi:acetate kinase